MFWKRLSITIILISLAFSLNISLAAGQGGVAASPSREITASEPATPVPGGPGFVMIPAAAFIPRSNSILHELYDGMTLMTLDGSSLDCTYFAPLMVPQGATITKVVLYYFDYDQAPGKTVSLYLTRGTLPAESGNVMADVFSLDSFSPTYAETTDIYEPVVDNQAYAYYLTLVLPWATGAEVILQFHAVRIDYTFSSNLPLVVR